MVKKQRIRKTSYEKNIVLHAASAFFFFESANIILVKIV